MKSPILSFAIITKAAANAARLNFNICTQGTTPISLGRKEASFLTRTVPNQFCGFGCRTKSASIEPPRFALVRSMG
jgi:hypothetical protein